MDQLALLTGIRSHASSAPPAAPRPSRFPVVLFSHGNQTNAFLYSNLHEELASHGYFVVAVDHPGAALFVSYPDGTVVLYSEASRLSRGEPGYPAALALYLRHDRAERTADLRFVRRELDKLALHGRPLGEFMSGRIGALGHSNGGIAAALLCQEAPLVDSCINLDGRTGGAPVAMESGIPSLSRPFLYMMKPFRLLTDVELQAEGLSRPEATRAQADAKERDRRLLAAAGQTTYRATLHGATHESFSDEPLLLNSNDRASSRLMQVMRQLVVEFFETTITDRGQKSLSSKSDTDVELEVLAPARPR